MSILKYQKNAVFSHIYCYQQHKSEKDGVRYFGPPCIYYIYTYTLLFIMRKLKYLILKIYIVIFTTPRYDKAVYALVMCLSVHLYVTSRYCTKMATSIRLHRTRDKSLEPFN